MYVGIVCVKHCRDERVREKLGLVSQQLPGFEVRYSIMASMLLTKW